MFGMHDVLVITRRRVRIGFVSKKNILFARGR
jgi:hypothetical protein